MRSARGAKRMVYPRAQLRAVVPVDWNDQKFDQPNGLVATYTDPKDLSRQIVLSARIIPAAVRDDKAKIDALVSMMIDQERKLPARLATGHIEELPATTPEGGLKVTHEKVTVPLGVMVVDTRYVVVRDVLASVRSIAKEADAESVNALAEKLAAGLKPVKE